MKRSQPLKRTPWNHRTHARRPRTHAASGAPKKPLGIPHSVREAVAARSGGHCDWCGEALCGVSEKHHRQPRGRGGEHTLANLTDLHPSCHQYVTEHPAEARGRGFMVSTWEDPADIPVLLWDGRVCLPLDTWTDIEEDQ